MRVYPYQSKDWDEDDTYRLYIGQTLEARSNDSLSGLRNVGAKAAIWQSDFEPFGMSSFDIKERTEVGFTSMIDYYYMDYYQNPFHHKMKSYALNNQVVHTIVYVWDIDWRIAIYQLLETMAYELEEKFDSEEQIKLTFNKVNDTIEVIGTVVSTIPHPVTHVIGIVMTTGSTAVGAIVPAMFPEIWQSNTEDMLNYVYVLMAAFEADHNTSPNEVVHVKLRYRYASHSAVLINHTSYYIDLVVENSVTQFLFGGTSITAAQNNSYSRGQVYAIRNYTDFTQFKAGTLSPGIPSSGGGGGPIEIVPV